MAVASIARPRAKAFGLDYKWMVMICTIFGTFMTMLDSTIVNIALPKITNVFGVTVNEGQLVITSYMLALAVIMPATGYLSDTQLAALKQQAAAALAKYDQAQAKGKEPRSSQ